MLTTPTRYLKPYSVSKKMRNVCNCLGNGLHQVEAVENHMPEIIMVDEIGTEAEALACRTIAERGVQLVATAHGQLLENLIKNPTLSDLVGGIQSVTLGKSTAVTLQHSCCSCHRNVSVAICLALPAQGRSMVAMVSLVVCMIMTKT